MQKYTGKEIIKLVNITKQYSNQIVLNQLSLNVNEGDFIGISGESGSGKSTLINIIGLLDISTSGNYYLRGKEVKNLDNQTLSLLRNKEFGFIFQMYHLIESLTVENNILLPKIYSREHKVDYNINELTNRLGISDILYKKAKNLSGGEKQRVAIARALLNNPSVIIADEPTGNLDLKNSQIVFDILMELNKLGKTIIIVTHSQAIFDMCPQKYTMREGRLCEVD